MIAQADPTLFWSNPTVVRIVALFAVMTLVFTVILLRRRKRSGHGAAVVCLVISVALHGVILFAVPRWKEKILGGSPKPSEQAANPGAADVAVAMFDPDMNAAETADLSDVADETANLAPLPLAATSELLKPIPPEPEPVESLPPPETILATARPAALASMKVTSEPSPPDASEHNTQLDDILGDWLSETLA